MSVIRMGDDGAAQATLAQAFCEMHPRGPVVQVVNAWSATSARIAAAAGAGAIGTTSFGVAVDHGVLDGELLPFEVAVRVGAEIVESVECP